ncbi:MAG: hypothetical protein MHM6MM_005634 [Cercozoa sp. M6MM]
MWPCGVALAIADTTGRHSFLLGHFWRVQTWMSTGALFVLTPLAYLLPEAHFRSRMCETFSVWALLTVCLQLAFRAAGAVLFDAPLLGWADEVTLLHAMPGLIVVVTCAHRGLSALLRRVHRWQVPLHARALFQRQWLRLALQTAALENRIKSRRRVLATVRRVTTSSDYTDRSYDHTNHSSGHSRGHSSDHSDESESVSEDLSLRVWLRDLDSLRQERQRLRRELQRVRSVSPLLRNLSCALIGMAAVVVHMGTCYRALWLLVPSALFVAGPSHRLIDLLLCAYLVFAVSLGLHDRITTSPKLRRFISYVDQLASAQSLLLGAAVTLMLAWSLPLAVSLLGLVEDVTLEGMQLPHARALNKAATSVALSAVFLLLGARELSRSLYGTLVSVIGHVRDHLAPTSTPEPLQTPLKARTRTADLDAALPLLCSPRRNLISLFEQEVSTPTRLLSNASSLSSSPRSAHSSAVRTLL